MSKSAVIFGFSGQDGSYLAQLLLDKGYRVYGVVRRVSDPNRSFITEMNLQRVELLEGDLGDDTSIFNIISKIKPDECYGLAAQSHVGLSFNQPLHTGNITGLGIVRILEQIRLHSPNTKFYHAASSEQFGGENAPQNELTPFNPKSPYAAAKCFAFQMTKIYREAYGLFACNGILFNHESPRRSKDFVTRKITSWIADNYYDLSYFGKLLKPTLKLGNLDALRDWGDAKSYVEGMWKMLQQDKADDYVLGTDQCHTVREFCEKAFKVINIELIWQNQGINTKGIDKDTGEILIEIDPQFYRPLEVNFLQSDSRKARNLLNWKPDLSFDSLVNWMVKSDLEKSNVHTKN